MTQLHKSEQEKMKFTKKTDQKELYNMLLLQYGLNPVVINCILSNLGVCDEVLA